MRGVSLLATSTTKTDADTMAFATLRFAGDNLDPADIGRILSATPTRAHRKGETYFAGHRAGWLTGQTGIWYLATDKLVESADLADHLRFIEKLLRPGPHDNMRLMQLRDVLTHSGADAHFSVFWRGPQGSTAPAIPGEFALLAHELSADIETDFETD